MREREEQDGKGRRTAEGGPRPGETKGRRGDLQLEGLSGFAMIVKGTLRLRPSEGCPLDLGRGSGTGERSAVRDLARWTAETAGRGEVTVVRCSGRSVRRTRLPRGTTI